MRLQSGDVQILMYTLKNRGEEVLRLEGNKEGG